MIVKLGEAIVLAIGAAAIIFISYWLGQQSYSWMPPEATLEAQKVDGLFSFLVMLGSIIFLGVLGTILHSLIFCRAKKGDFSEGHPVRSDTLLEILWTGIPTVLVLWIAVQSIHIYALLDIQGVPEVAHAAMGMKAAYAAAPAPPVKTVEVTVQQWAWIFHYPEQDVTSAELHLPVNQRVRLAMRSKDVLHGFYIPAFRLKQDIVPGTEFDLVFSPTLEGKYRLQDSQLSGTYFSLMQADVFVESPQAYQQWLDNAAQNPTPPVDLSVAEAAQPPQLLGRRWGENHSPNHLQTAHSLPLLP